MMESSSNEEEGRTDTSFDGDFLFGVVVEGEGRDCCCWLECF
jgi:hypothetical protein